MACLPTYKGVRYQSLDEIRELLRGQQKMAALNNEDIEELGNAKIQHQLQNTEVDLNSTLGLNLTLKNEIEKEKAKRVGVAKSNPELNLDNFDSIFPHYASFTPAEKQIVIKLAQEGRIEIKCNL